MDVPARFEPCTCQMQIKSITALGSLNAYETQFFVNVEGVNSASFMLNHDEI
jgi:hypothetical protein